MRKPPEPEEKGERNHPLGTGDQRPHEIGPRRTGVWAIYRPKRQGTGRFYWGDGV